jgi:two-component system sensor histidine kinase/response regulator
MPRDAIKTTTRTRYKQRRLLLEFLLQKPGAVLPELAHAPGSSERLLREDCDELQRSKEELRQEIAALQVRNEELEAYARMVAHDLKDPLAVLVVTSNLINDIPDLTIQELKEYSGQIRATAYEMNRIINSLLLFAEVSQAEAPLELVDMGWVVANVQDRLGYLIEQRRARIDLPKAWPKAIGYAPWIEEVWANYLSNALKHGGQPPQVELGGSPQPDGMVRFWTRDNGPGLPPEARDTLFSTSPRIGRADGHGLGLSIAHQLVEKLGGEVGVESEAGQGSLFYFTLPAGPASP